MSFLDAVHDSGTPHLAPYPSLASLDHQQWTITHLSSIANPVKVKTLTLFDAMFFITKHKQFTGLIQVLGII